MTFLLPPGLFVFVDPKLAATHVEGELQPPVDAWMLIKECKFHVSGPRLTNTRHQTHTGTHTPAQAGSLARTHTHTHILDMLSRTQTHTVTDTNTHAVDMLIHTRPSFPQCQI